MTAGIEFFYFEDYRFDLTSLVCTSMCVAYIGTENK